MFTKSQFNKVTSMPARDPNEVHRAATPLELFYDLVSVVAIASAASLLHHGFSNDHVLQAVGLFLVTFWMVWWAWMNFTWFASAYESDDPVYRIAVFVQIVGALIMAVGIRQVFDDLEFRFVFLGFIIMRLSLVYLWLRVAKNDPDNASSALRMAIGISLSQICWGFVVFRVPQQTIFFGIGIMMIVEHLIPMFAKRVSQINWHRGHIIERYYRLLTIIVLGESILSSYYGIQTIIDNFSLSLLMNLCGGLLILFSMWWLYFDEEEFQILNSVRGVFIWAQGHFVIFASIAALGAGLSVVTDQVVGHAKINATTASACVAVPVATYLIALLFIHKIPSTQKSSNTYVYPIASLLILVAPFIAPNVFLIGLILCLLVCVHIKEMNS